METNTAPPYYFDLDRKAVFIKTRGYAKCIAHGVEMYVPFDFGK